MAITLLNLVVRMNVQIEQKFLLKEHTKMECDSVHRNIEETKKLRNVSPKTNQYLFGGSGLVIILIMLCFRALFSYEGQSNDLKVIGKGGKNKLW